MQEAPQKRRCLVLDDSPAAKDAFGSHERIAAAIKKLVSSEQGGKAIALVGRWGSGKSTIVNLLRLGPKPEKGQVGFEANEPIVFVFDTWAHEGDPLRRTFLEQLIRFLADNGCVPRDKWGSKLNELTGRRKVATTTSTPNLTTWGGVFALALYLAAIGLGVLRLGLVFPAYFYPALFLCIAPLLVLLIAKWLARNGNGGFDLLGLLVNKTKETTTTDTLESTEPTSVEFEACFKELMSDAALSCRKLLVTIDNLDRVDVSDAKKLWSSVRTFLDFFGGDMPLWASNIWVLIPYALSGISRLWSAKQDDAVVGAFLAKSFQICFEVPAPLIPDWRGFLHDQLRTAFPDHPEDDFYRISRIFAIILSANEAPTPRDIKLFVNQIGSAFKTAAEDFPLPVLALHVLVGPKGWKPGEAMARSEKLGPYIGKDWQETLAAIEFGMPRERARHVLYGDRLQKALTEADGAEVKILLQYRGVDSTVEDLIDGNAPVWAKNDTRLIGCAAYALGDPHAPASAPIRHAWNRLLEETGRISDLKALDEKSSQGFATLIRFANDPKVTAAMLGAMRTWAPITTPEAEATGSNAGYLQGALEIVEAAEDTGHTEMIEKHFRVGATGDDYTNAAATVSELSPWQQYWRFFRPACAVEDVSRSLDTLAINHQWSDKTDRACAVMLKVPDWPCSGLRDHLAAVLGQPQALKPEEGAAIVRTIFRLKGKVAEAETGLQGIMRNGWGFHHLQLALDQRDWIGMSSWILAAMFYFPQPRFAQAPGKIVAGANTYTNFCRDPSGYREAFEALQNLTLELSTIEELLELRDLTQIPRTVIDAILAKHGGRPGAFALFSPKLIIDQFPKLKEVLGVEAVNRLILVSLENGNLLAPLLQTGFSQDKVDLYRVVLTKASSPELRNKLGSALKKLEKDRWRQSLDTNDSMLGLSFDLSKEGVKLDLGYPLKDALVEMAEAGVSRPHISNQFYSSIVSLLSDEQVYLLKKQLRDQVIASDSPTTAIIDLFSPLLNDCKLLCEDADRLVREGFRNILTRLDHTELGWVAEIVKQCPDILKNCHPATKMDFIERVDDIAKKALKQEAQQEITELARTLGIGIEKPPLQKKA